MKFFTMNKSEDNKINDGILYFAQRIDEMLKHTTCHLYKTPVLNTYLLATEYLSTAQLVSKDIINENHLTFVFKEFLESFKNDIIIKEYISTAERTAFLEKLQSSNALEKNKLMHYILHRLNKYNLWCKKYIEKIVPQEKEKKKIELALKAYVPGLIAQGYSLDYIYYYNKTTFNQSDKTDVEMFAEFINRFDFNERKYDVYVALHKSANSFKEVLEDRLDVIFDFDFSEAKEFKYYEKKYILAKLEIKALDQRNAANIAYELLDFFYKFHRFMNNDRKRWYLNKCMVKQEMGDFAFVYLKDERYSFQENNTEKDNGKLSASIITALLHNAHCSFEQIEKVIMLHNTAIENTDLSNGFLNLWSILEVLFVTDNDCSKINEIEKKLIPILQKEYIVMIFKELDENLRENLTADQYSEILDSIEGSDNKYKIAALVVLNEYDELRKKLNTYLSSFPILRSRIANINSICHRRCDMKDDLDRFTRRVTWHLIRLYRTRNSIIHSGEIADNLKLLGEHLHSYVDVCILEIIVSLIFEKHLCTIDNVLINDIFQMESIIKEMSNKEPFKKDDLFLCCNSIEYSSHISSKESIDGQSLQ